MGIEPKEIGGKADEYGGGEGGRAGLKLLNRIEHELLESSEHGVVELFILTLKKLKFDHCSVGVGLGDFYTGTLFTPNRSDANYEFMMVCSSVHTSFETVGEKKKKKEEGTKMLIKHLV